MNRFTALALAAALTVTGASATFANGIDALGSATSVSITTVSGASDNILLSSGGRVMEQVDIDTLRARVQLNKSIAAQLERFGVTADDVIGVTGSDPSDVTLYVRG